MKTIAYRTTDKTAWGIGPWTNEPDKVQWRDEATGLPCLIVRNSFGGLCGYVGVGAGHPLFGKDYDDAPVSAHGGITFSGLCQGHDGEAESHAVCHVVEEGEDDRAWWLGFDCAHLGDYLPANGRLIASVIPGDWGTYKNLAYVTAEVEGLARQLKDLAGATGEYVARP